MKTDLRVLIIEDHESDAELSVRQLEKANYNVSYQRVENVEDLETSLKKQSWDIVFSDYQLPNFTALEAFEIFKNAKLDIPFILISGAIGEEAAVNIIKSGAQNYVMKSNLSKLGSVVKRELLEAQARREQKSSDELLKIQQEKLIESAKLSTLGDMSGNFFKSNLEYLLEKEGLKQSQLSRDAGISKQTISDWLKKDSLINIQQALKLTKYFKITVEELFNHNLRVSSGQDLGLKQEFLNTIKTPFHMIDLDGPSTFCNQAFCDLLGFSEYDLHSRIFTDLIHPDDLAHVRIMRKRFKDEKVLFSQIDMRYLTNKHGFRWINNLSVNSLTDKKLFVFSFPIEGMALEPFTLEKIMLEKFIKKELVGLQLAPNYTKKLEFRSEIDPKISINTDRNVFKCLLRSLITQFQFTDFESSSKFEVVFKSREEASSVLIIATIHCAINPKRLDISRVQKVASLIRVEVTENYAANIYSCYMAFPKL